MFLHLSVTPSSATGSGVTLRPAPVPVAVVLLSFTKNKTDTEGCLLCFWRRRGDSNSRAGYPTYA
ncbi:MAG: hypothetical protein IKH13_10530, partial [Clostridia bacterium]|nr:hypothetical protein [Clostridia bacterium]